MKNYGKTLLGTSDVIRGCPEPAPGFAVWIEAGEWFTAPKVDPAKFRRHDYLDALGECKCGCIMGGGYSSGPVDPFGACPENPREPTPLQECDLCHDEFPLDQIEFNEHGQPLCPKHRETNRKEL